MKRLLSTLLIISGVIIILAYLFDVTYLFKAIRTIYLKGHTTAFLEDYKSFDNDTVKAGSNTISWPLHSSYNEVLPTEKLIQTHEEYGTIAYLIIKNDSIFHEAYYDGFDSNSLTNSFSMAKTFISALLGKAIMDGHIQSLDQPLGDFFPKYKDTKTTVGDLSSMASGLDWDERYYSPFSITTKAYFYDELDKMMLELDIVEEPGIEFKYLSGSTQLLAMVIEKASGKKIAEYSSESLWLPLGAKNDALWQLDSSENGLVKAYCCFASNARDFARFGRLYKNFGKINGNQILDSTFVATSTQRRFRESPYGYGVWIKEFNGKHQYALRGHLGQYVMVIPEDNLIVVRLGHMKGPLSDDNQYPVNYWTYLEEAYEMLK